MEVLWWNLYTMHDYTPPHLQSCTAVDSTECSSDVFCRVSDRLYGRRSWKCLRTHKIILTFAPIDNCLHNVFPVVADLHGESMSQYSLTWSNFGPTNFICVRRFPIWLHNMNLVLFFFALKIKLTFPSLLHSEAEIYILRPPSQFHNRLVSLDKWLEIVCSLHIRWCCTLTYQCACFVTLWYLCL